MITVFIEDVAEKLEEAMDTWEQYLNVMTGEFESLSDGSYAEVDEELAEKIEDSHDYVRLPNQYEIHEYRIMSDFADTVTNPHKQSSLYYALNGRKPYRRFKDAIIDLNLEQAYYDFRADEFLKIAREWCEENQIPYAHKRR